MLYDRLIINLVNVKAVREGGREEYDAIVKSYDKPKTPTECLSAM